MDSHLNDDIKLLSIKFMIWYECICKDSHTKPLGRNRDMESDIWERFITGILSEICPDTSQNKR